MISPLPALRERPLAQVVLLPSPMLRRALERRQARRRWVGYVIAVLIASAIAAVLL